MKEGFITVRSEADATLVINVPEIPFGKVWPQRGAKLVCDREKLEEAYYYSPTVEYFLTNGLLVTDDVKFLQDVGLMDEEEKTDIYPPLTEKEMEEMLGKMTIPILKKRLESLSAPQIENLGDYAIEHNDLLKMDRIELLSEVTGRKLAKAIANK